jgi:molecular chaperone DnaJ
VLQVESDARFQRRGADIYSELNISYPEAALGEDIEIETVRGKTKLEIKAGTKYGQVYTLKNQGMPKLNKQGQTGDHYVQVHIETPNKISGEERELLQKLKEVRARRR